MFRVVRYEQLESRQLLAADPAVAGAIAGGVYLVNDDVGQSPLADVSLTLRDETGVPVATAKTDAHGGYRFELLAPGLYAIDQAQPLGLADLGVSIGDGGGEPLTANLIGDILVEADSQLSGYNFYEAPLVQAGEGDLPPLITHGGSVEANAFWQLTSPTPTVGPAELRAGTLALRDPAHSPTSSLGRLLDLPVAQPSDHSSDLATRGARRQVADDPNLLESVVSGATGELLLDGAVKAARWLEAVWDDLSAWAPTIPAADDSAPATEDQAPLVATQNDGQAGDESAAEMEATPVTPEATANLTPEQTRPGREMPPTVAESSVAWVGNE